MLDRHVHCSECLIPVATEIKVKGGKTKPATIQSGIKLTPVPVPQGVGFAEITVPVCDSCAERIREAAEKAAASRLVVPEISPSLSAARSIKIE